MSDADIMALHAVGSEGLLPDRTLVLTLDMGEAAARADVRDGGKADRFALQSYQYHQKVAGSFEEMTKADPGRFRLVSASGNAAAVTARLVAALDDLL